MACIHARRRATVRFTTRAPARFERHEFDAGELAYRLYAAAERRSRAAEALSYNGLVQRWPEVAPLAHRTESAEQFELFQIGQAGNAIR